MPPYTQSCLGCFNAGQNCPHVVSAVGDYPQRSRHQQPNAHHHPNGHTTDPSGQAPASEPFQPHQTGNRPSYPRDLNIGPPTFSQVPQQSSTLHSSHYSSVLPPSAGPNMTGGHWTQQQHQIGGQGGQYQSHQAETTYDWRSIEGQNGSFWEDDDELVTDTRDYHHSYVNDSRIDYGSHATREQRPIPYVRDHVVDADEAIAGFDTRFGSTGSAPAASSAGRRSRRR